MKWNRFARSINYKIRAKDLRFNCDLRGIVKGEIVCVCAHCYYIVAIIVIIARAINFHFQLGFR